MKNAMKNENTILISSNDELSVNELSVIQKNVDSWVTVDNNELKRMVYLSSGDTLKKIAIELIPEKMVSAIDRNHLAITDTETKKERAARRKKGERRNRGINDQLRRFFDAERRKRNKEITLKELYSLVKVEFPHMTEKLLKIYLYNKKQLPGIKFNNESKIINILSK